MQVRRIHAPATVVVVRSLYVLAVVAMLAPRLASGQTVTDYIVDPSPPAAPLEKTIDYFTSTTIPSVVLGSSSGDGGPGGIYLYQSSGDLSGPWTMTTIDPLETSTNDLAHSFIPATPIPASWPAAQGSWSGTITR